MTNKSDEKCEFCKLSKYVKHSCPTPATEEWEEEWNVIQEREYDNCLTKGLTDKQAQSIIDEHDKWFHTQLEKARQQFADEVLKELDKMNDWLTKIAGGGNGRRIFIQAQEDLRKKIEELKK